MLSFAVIHFQSRSTNLLHTGEFQQCAQCCTTQLESTSFVSFVYIRTYPIAHMHPKHIEHAERAVFSKSVNIENTDTEARRLWRIGPPTAPHVPEKHPIHKRTRASSLLFCSIDTHIDEHGVRANCSHPSIQHSNLVRNALSLYSRTTKSLALSEPLFIHIAPCLFPKLGPMHARHSSRPN